MTTQFGFSRVQMIQLSFWNHISSISFAVDFNISATDSLLTSREAKTICDSFSNLAASLLRRTSLLSARTLIWRECDFCLLLASSFAAVSFSWKKILSLLRSVIVFESSAISWCNFWIEIFHLSLISSSMLTRLTCWPANSFSREEILDCSFSSSWACVLSLWRSFSFRTSLSSWNKRWKKGKLIKYSLIIF